MMSNVYPFHHPHCFSRLWLVASLSLSLSLSLFATLSLPSPSHEVSLARSTADAPILIPQEMPLSGSVCVSAWECACVCLRNSCQSISLLCFECQQLWVCERTGCELEWELMSLYGTALGRHSKRVSFCYELTCKIWSAAQQCNSWANQISLSLCFILPAVLSCSGTSRITWRLESAPAPLWPCKG